MAAIKGEELPKAPNGWLPFLLLEPILNILVLSKNRNWNRGLIGIFIWYIYIKPH